MEISNLLQKYLKHNLQFWKDLKAKRKIYNQKRNIQDLYRDVHDKSQPIFVLSTGRTGTLFLTNLFALSPQLLSNHEPEPELSYHSKLAYESPQENAALKLAVDMSRYELLRNAFLMKKRYVETNNRISFFAYYLAELYPEAKFIHLIRRPENFIKSGISRNWYSGLSVYDEGRISDEELFVKYTIEEKVAWLWAATNNFILDFTLLYPQRCLQLKSEDLFGNPEKARDVFNFCQLPQPSDQQLRKVVYNRYNAGKTGTESIDLEKLLHIPHMQKLMREFQY